MAQTLTFSVVNKSTEISEMRFSNYGDKQNQVWRDVHIREKHENSSVKAPDHLVIFKCKALEHLN